MLIKFSNIEADVAVGTIFFVVNFTVEIGGKIYTAAVPATVSPTGSGALYEHPITGGRTLTMFEVAWNRKPANKNERSKACEALMDLAKGKIEKHKLIYTYKAGNRRSANSA